MRVWGIWQEGGEVSLWAHLPEEPHVPASAPAPICNCAHMAAWNRAHSGLSHHALAQDAHAWPMTIHTLYLFAV